MTAIVLFRRDLRLSDNPAWAAACQNHETVYAVYIHDPVYKYGWTAGAASRWWLHHSLDSLAQRLALKGGSLNILRGETLSVVLQQIRGVGADTVYWNRLYDPDDISRDTKLKAAIHGNGQTAHGFQGALWHEPSKILNKAGGPYRVFTPFWRNLRTQIEVTAPMATPKPKRWGRVSQALPLAALELLPKIAWDRGFYANWQPGEDGAHRSLENFANSAVTTYSADRDAPAMRGTSRLSPHLHFGEITPRQVHYALFAKVHGDPKFQGTDLEAYLRQLGWREFAHYLLHHFPKTSDENFNSRFDAFPWACKDTEAIERWQRGMTGIPLVDAGMRELWHTGWMHNRVRMVVASYLTKNLRQHWLEGAKWFWDTLVDADLPNNSLGWQWVAGSGADAAPYFRIFNPLTQSRKFDPGGAYLRRWLPELASVPAGVIHEPWKDEAALARSGYPKPTIDLAASRQRALTAYRSLEGE